MLASDYLISPNLSVGKTLEKLQNAGHKALFLVDGEDRLCGCVTDGDIRRFLLSGGNLADPVASCATKHPTVVEGFCEREAKHILKDKQLPAVPMVKDGILHAIVFPGETVHVPREEISAPVIIMAGGLGTRLYPYTSILPKALIPVAGRTMTEQIIDRFKKFGCRDITLVVNHKKQLIKSYFAEVDTGCNVTCQDEDKPLGTGGGLFVFKNKGICPAFVTNCDTVIEADYADILRRHTEDGNAVTMVCASTSMTVPYGVAEVDESGALVGMREKPKFDFLMNTGFYVISEEFLAEVRDDEFQPITEIIDRCKQKGLRVGVYTIDGECFVDIGQLNDLKVAEEKIS